MAKKKQQESEMDDERPTDVPVEMPEPEPDPVIEEHPPVLSNEVPPAASQAASQETPPDHTSIHGVESIVSNERSYYIVVDGRRYVHVGEYGGEWVYRPD
jgi:hypothetical protein